MTSILRECDGQFYKSSLQLAIAFESVCRSRSPDHRCLRKTTSDSPKYKSEDYTPVEKSVFAGRAVCLDKEIVAARSINGAEDKTIAMEEHLYNVLPFNRSRANSQHRNNVKFDSGDNSTDSDYKVDILDFSIPLLDPSEWREALDMSGFSTIPVQGDAHARLPPKKPETRRIQTQSRGRHSRRRRAEMDQT